MRVCTVSFVSSTQQKLVVDENSFLVSAALMSGSDALITTNPQLTNLNQLADGIAEFPVFQLGTSPTDNLLQMNLNIDFPIGEIMYINATNPQTFVSLIFDRPPVNLG